MMKNGNWDEHQNDPDNWLVIPEFNVLPADVLFEGFKFPILGPEDAGFFWKVPIFEAVHSVRNEARKRFTTLAELNTCYDAAIMSDDDTFDLTLYRPPSWDEKTIFAFRYQSFFFSVERAVTYFPHKKAEAMGFLASAMCTGLDMFEGKPPDANTVRKIRSDTARLGAIATNQKARAKIEEWKEWYVKNHMKFINPRDEWKPASIDDVAAVLAGKARVAIPTARGWILEARKENPTLFKSSRKR